MIKMNNHSLQSSQFSTIARRIVAGVIAFWALLAGSQAQTITLAYTNIWKIAPADGRTYVSNNGGVERGITVNPITTNVLIASRNLSSNQVVVLDGNTGALIRFLSTNGIFGGTFAVNKIQVADDGAVYVANLSTSTASPLVKLYRWASDSDTSAPMTVYSGDPMNGSGGLRWGDAMALRGAGTNTQIAIGGSANTNLAFFTTTDGTNFTSQVIRTPYTAINKGLTFGPSNTLYIKFTADSTLKFCSFDLTANMLTQTASYSGYDSSMCAITVENNLHFLAGPLTLNTANLADHTFRIYDITSTASPSLKLATNMPAANADSNLAGEADYAGDRLVGLSANEGVLAFKTYYVTGAIPPSITSPPMGGTYLQGGFATLIAKANGTQPLVYQWYTNTVATPLPNSNTNALTITNLTSDNNGKYFVIITNSGGAATSAVVSLSVSNSVLSTWLMPFYTIAPGSRTYLADDNNQRGLAYNSASNHLLVASRTPGTSIHVLDADTGADLNTMDVSALSGGTFNLNLIAVADDGAVYGCNLETGGGDFKLYRWADDGAATPSTVIFENPAAAPRLGDSMTIRGAGTNTQIILGEQTGGTVHIFTTTDGTTFSENVVTIAGTTTDSGRNGLAFGRGNTYWSKDYGGVLRFMSFDLGTLKTATLAIFGNGSTDYILPTTVQPIAYDPVNDLLAGITIGNGNTNDPAPDNLRLYDVANLAPVDPIWLDTEFFATGNANTFGTGALGFGNGRLYALDSHNGIAVFTVNITNGAPAISVQPATLTNNVGDNALFGVNASGYPHSYQWLYEGVPLDGSTTVEGATNASLILANTQLANSTNYSVIISNSSGAVTSAVAQLWFRPIITSQPPPSQIVSTNNPASITVVADGSPLLTYQWRLNGSDIMGANSAMYSIANAQLGDSGNYAVVVTNAYGAVTSQVSVLYVQPGFTTGAGIGLRGDYYTNHFSPNPFAGVPVLTTTNAQVDFDWGVGSPDPLVTTDYFTVRWTGQVQPLFDQTYTFYTKSDDGSRLWVGGQLVVANWFNQPATERSGTITLNANQLYDCVMEYYENTVFASAVLSWSSLSQPKEVIPMTQLYPAGALLADPSFSFGVTNATNLVFTWGVGTYALAWSTNLAGPYTNVISDVTSPYIVPIGPQAQKFYRLWIR